MNDVRTIGRLSRVAASILLLVTMCSGLLLQLPWAPVAETGTPGASEVVSRASSCSGAECANSGTTEDCCSAVSCAHCLCHLFLAAAGGHSLAAPESLISFVITTGQEYESFLPPPLIPPPSIC